jgi:hypothetical protein
MRVFVLHPHLALRSTENLVVFPPFSSDKKIIAENTTNERGRESKNLFPSLLFIPVFLLLLEPLLISRDKSQMKII